MRRVVAVVVVAAALTACSSGGDSKGPSASVTVTTLSPIEREVEAAYLKSWDVYARALRTTEDVGLEDVFARDALTSTRREIADLRAARSAVRVEVEHDYRIRLNVDGTALVADRPINHSVLIDPMSGEPKEPDPNKRVSYDYTMRNLGGSWRITDIVRH